MINSLKFLSLPTVFLSNLIVYIFIANVIDNKYKIGNYIVIIILFGFIFSSYSTYKVYKKSVHNES